MNRVRLIAGLTVCILVVASLVAWYLQPSPVDVARRHAAEQGIAAESLVLLGHQGSGNLLGRKEAVQFQLQGAKPAKKLVVELRQPAYFLAWQVVEFRTEAHGSAADGPDAPRGEAIADPVLRQAREEADSILDGLLAGKFDQDQDLWPVARKVKGFQSWAIKSQKVVREGAAEFQGVLTRPGDAAGFKVTLVKQASGKWAVGAFSGPNPE
jgi:hypothetical protein